MLYGYPITATAENWLHDCLYQMIESVHISLQTAQTPLDWPDIIPVSHRDKLIKRDGLETRLGKYIKAFKRLNSANQAKVIKALRDQNNINLLLSGVCDCDAIGDLPKPIQKPIKELFEFAFKLLTPLGIRDRHYIQIYDTLPAHVCPFCGGECFDAPGAPREALDHYLSESKYPFAAANLRNLVPMGNKCNSRYKLAQDILRGNKGQRRKSFDPYNPPLIRVSLDNSQPLPSVNGQAAQWQIDFIPDSEEVNTWDEVFHIRERYKRDVLEQSFNTWLRHFASWCKSAHVVPDSNQAIVCIIERYVNYLEAMGFNDLSFLKAAVFRMLYNYCQQGNQRFIDFIKGIVKS